MYKSIKCIFVHIHNSLWGTPIHKFNNYLPLKTRGYIQKRIRTLHSINAYKYGLYSLEDQPRHEAMTRYLILLFK